MRWPYPNIGVLTTRAFRNLLNKIFGDIGSDLQEQKSRVDNLIMSNPQPSEVEDMRTGRDGQTYPVARDMVLDEIGKTEAAQAQINQDNAVQLKYKANINYVDQVMSSLSNGGPDEIFYSISALTAAYPGGVNRTKLVFDTSFTDGAHAMIWDGTSWIDVGLYQGNGVVDGSVKLSSLDQNLQRNIIDKSANLIKQIGTEIGIRETQIDEINKKLNKAVAMRYNYIITEDGSNIATENDDDLLSGQYYIDTDKTVSLENFPADAYYTKQLIDNLPNTLPAFRGAIDTNGSKGLVPLPTSFDRDFALYGDGRWREDERLINLESILTVNGVIPTTVGVLTEGRSGITTEDGDVLVFQSTKYLTTENGVVPHTPFNVYNVNTHGDDSTPPNIYRMPYIILNGNDSAMTKDIKVNMDYAFNDYPSGNNYSGTTTVKWQGSSSISYPKKNYTINLDTDIVPRSGWPSNDKWVLKADYIDFSHVRNILCSKLWGQIVKSRVTQNPQLYDLPNGGATDGFPILLIMNGKYMGVYNFTIPKDDVMFGMTGENDQESIVSSEYSASSVTLFKSQADSQTDDTIKLSTEPYDAFSIEYAANDDFSWQRASINALIQACIDCQSETDFDTNVAPHLDVHSAIDYLIFSMLIGNNDGLGRNYLLFTTDGIKWGFSAYDMDATFGNNPFGSYWFSPTKNTVAYYNQHKLFDLLFTYKKSDIKARFDALKSVMSTSNVVFKSYDYASRIPKIAHDEEVRIWSYLPSTDVNNVAQINTWYRDRFEIVANEINNL